MIRQLFTNYVSSFRGLPRAVYLLSLVVFINRSGTMVLFFMSLFITGKLDYSVAEAGQLISVYGIGAMGGAWLGGWLSDKIGFLRVQFFSLILNGLGFIILAYLNTAWTIGIALFLVGVMAEAFHPANTTAVGFYCSAEESARGFAINRLAVNLGISIGPALGGLLAVYSYKLLFWVDGLTCILSSLLLLTLFKFEDGHSPSASKADAENSSSPYRDGVFLYILLLLFFSGLIFIQILSTWPLYLKEFYGLVEDKIGILIAINAIFISFIEVPLIRKLEHFNPFIPIAAGAFFFGAGFAILPLGDSFLFAAFSVIIWSIGEMLVFPIITSVISNRASDQTRGKYMGLYTLTFSTCFVAGPAIGSAVYDYLSPQLLWSATGVIGIVLTIAFFNLKKYNTA